MADESRRRGDTMSFLGWFTRARRQREAELRAALESVDGLSARLSELRDEIDELREENELLAHSVLIDQQTGLANASAFELDLHQLDARRRRSEQPYSVVLAEIDRHDARPGDAAGYGARFRAVADVFKSSVRQGDRAYRCEGDRLAVLLAGADLPRAVAAGERFRTRVEGAGIEDPISPGRSVTVTVGVIEAGFRHPSAKDVCTELERIVTDRALVATNQLVWPH